MFPSWLSHSLAVCPQAEPLTSLSVSWSQQPQSHRASKGALSIREDRTKATATSGQSTNDRARCAQREMCIFIVLFSPAIRVFSYSCNRKQSRDRSLASKPPVNGIAAGQCPAQHRPLEGTEASLVAIQFSWNHQGGGPTVAQGHRDGSPEARPRRPAVRSLERPLAGRALHSLSPTSAHTLGPEGRAPREPSPQPCPQLPPKKARPQALGPGQWE